MSWLSSLTRSLKVLRIIIVQTIQRNIVTLQRSQLFSPTTQPDAHKTIPNRKYLYSSRVFKPSRYDPGTTLPLVIMVHGGGFLMNNPSADDPLARRISDECNCLVVSIDYRKAPINRFPAAYEDIVESVLSIIHSNDLLVDKNKIILYGTSSGGSLVLSAVQDSRLQGKVHGVVSVTAAVNLVPSEEEQMARRPDPTVPDFLAGMWDDLLDWYVGSREVEKLKDPRISPAYFKERKDLPANILLIACEHDLLWYETKVMADRLKVAESKKDLEEGHSHAIRRTQWKLVEGQPHGFIVFPASNKAKEVVRLRAKEEMYQEIFQWLRDV